MTDMVRAGTTRETMVERDTRNKDCKSWIQKTLLSY